MSYSPETRVTEQSYLVERFINNGPHTPSCEIMGRAQEREEGASHGRGNHMPRARRGGPRGARGDRGDEDGDGEARRPGAHAAGEGRRRVRGTHGREARRRPQHRQAVRPQVPRRRPGGGARRRAQEGQAPQHRRRGPGLGRRRRLHQARRPGLRRGDLDQGGARPPREGACRRGGPPGPLRGVEGHGPAHARRRRAAPGPRRLLLRAARPRLREEDARGARHLPAALVPSSSRSASARTATCCRGRRRGPRPASSRWTRSPASRRSPRPART